MSNYRQVSNRDSEVHFSEALFGEVEQSRMLAHPFHLTTLNAGDIVPIYCREVLPHEHLSLDLDFVLRQTTLLTPTMGNMMVDFYAFWVPNRVVNRSFKAVMGENYNGSWTGNPVSLAPLVGVDSPDSIQIPVGSIADYYGFPTQRELPKSVLSLCHDLKFRGYVMIYNEYFRDQNYQPPIAMSTLNVYQGFLDPDTDSAIPLNGENSSVNTNFLIDSSIPSDGSFGAGAVKHELFGSGDPAASLAITGAKPLNHFKATSKPLKANKLHDYFTSALPSPQKAPSSIFAPVTGSATASPQFVVTTNDYLSGSYPTLSWNRTNGDGLAPSTAGVLSANAIGTETNSSSDTSPRVQVYPSNLKTVGGPLSVSGLAISIDDFRMAAAIQQVYEALGRGGSRYRSYLRSFFGIDVDDPFDDIPKRLGHLRRSLDLFQTAQTSASQDGSTPQGNLSAFGYTSNGGQLFPEVSFIEHGYIHVFAVVRHKNIYPSFMSRDNFRLSMLDFYQPQMCNISEQPLYCYELNPFSQDPLASIGYQEAWAEYRYEPDYVTGYMRPGISESLSLWNYADSFNSSLSVIDSDFIRSNSQQVLDRTLAVKSDLAPQFKLAVRFSVDKILPMPTYSVPGMDII